MKRRHRSVAVLATALPLLYLMGSGVAAPAPMGRVAVIDSPRASATARHCLTLIREELISEGFEVSLIDPGPRFDPISLGAVMRRQEGIAAVALVGDPRRDGAELWILNRMGPTSEIRRIPAVSDDRERVPEILAIRTVEMLRASAIKLVEAEREQARERERAASPRPAVPAPAVPAPPLSQQPPASSPAASVRAAPPPQAVPGSAGLGVEVGVSLLENIGKVGPAALPLGRLRLRLGDRLTARLTMAGLGSKPRVDSVEGWTTISQMLALAEVAFAFRPGATIRPTLSVGGGMLYLESEGGGHWPFQGLRQTRLTAAMNAGVGVLARARPNVSFALEVNGVLAAPHPTIRFYQSTAATVAYPALLGSLTMVVWL